MLTMRAGEIAAELARDAQGVAEHLLPAGKKQSGYWVCGSVQGEKGKSLAVKLTGPSAGQWKDYAEGTFGDLIDLWAATRSIPLADAIKEAGEYLGVKPAKFSGPQPERITLKAPKGATRADADAAVMRWLIDTRQLSAQSVAAYRVAAKDGAAMLPAFTPEGEIQYLKFRSVVEKKFWSEAGGKPCLFGWQAIPERERQVVICEGELDAIAWYSYGYPALSPTNGAGNAQWIDAEFDRLARFDQIFLSFDMDDAGRSSVPEIVERLGVDRCYIVELPAKDANECRIQGISESEIHRAIGAAKSMDPEELVSAAEYAEQVVRLFHPDGEPDPGVRLPWRKAGDRVVLRAGEVSLLGGVNGHGKSELAGHILLDALDSGERCCVASMEFKPERWLRRLTRQACGRPEPSDRYIRAVHEWYRGKLWAFSAVGTTKASRILEVFRYAVRRYGIRYFVVDNLAKCGFPEDDYNGQKAFIDQLTDFARDYEAHVQVCVHMRKGESEDKPAGKMDVKGTGAITDMVDTVLVIWRNKKKEEDRRVAEQAGEPFNEAEHPDAVLKCVKQRNGEHEPTLKLWFCGRSHQFLERHGGRAHQYVRWSDAAEVHDGASA